MNGSIIAGDASAAISLDVARFESKFMRAFLFLNTIRTQNPAKRTDIGAGSEGFERKTFRKHTQCS
jgi:hypothetical protein